MEQMGRLTIYAIVVAVSNASFAVTQRRKAISSIYCRRSEAQSIIDEHDRQVRQYRTAVEGYNYSWQAEPEIMEPQR